MDLNVHPGEVTGIARDGGLPPRTREDQRPPQQAVCPQPLHVLSFEKERGILGWGLMDRVVGTRAGSSQLRRVGLQAHTRPGKRAVPAGASEAASPPRQGLPPPGPRQTQTQEDGLSRHRSPARGEGCCGHAGVLLPPARPQDEGAQECWRAVTAGAGPAAGLQRPEEAWLPDAGVPASSLGGAPPRPPACTCAGRTNGGSELIKQPGFTGLELGPGVSLQSGCCWLGGFHR